MGDKIRDAISKLSKEERRFWGDFLALLLDDPGSRMTIEDFEYKVRVILNDDSKMDCTIDAAHEIAELSKDITG